MSYFMNPLFHIMLDNTISITPINDDNTFDYSITSQVVPTGNSLGDSTSNTLHNNPTNSLMTTPTAYQSDSPADSSLHSVDTRSTTPPTMLTHITNNRPQRIRNPPTRLTYYVCNHTSLSTDFPIENHFSFSFESFSP